METLAKPAGQYGLTLVELLLAMAVASILLAFASASVRALRAEVGMTTAVNHLVHAIHAARLTALGTGNDVVLCASTDGERCAADGAWHAGWLTFVNTNAGSSPQPDNDERILQQSSALQSLSIRANRRHFVLRPFGRRSTNGTLVLCDARGSRNARAVVVSYTGKPRTDRYTAGGDSLACPPAS